MGVKHRQVQRIAAALLLLISLGVSENFVDASEKGEENRQPEKIRKCENLLSFLAINKPNSGILIRDVSNWYSPADVQIIKKAYPVPKERRHGKIVVYSSDPNDRDFYFRLHPDYLQYYEQNAPLRTIAEKMRREILDSLQKDLRPVWEEKTYGVSVQWSDGSEPLLDDHVQHVHRDEIVASLAVEGAGTIAKVAQDVSHLDYKEVYEVADQMPGHVYHAGKGELVILNAVHYPGGGLHAAPKTNEKYPERFAIFVSIDE